jgi:hypothetical protein
MVGDWMPAARSWFKYRRTEPDANHRRQLNGERYGNRRGEPCEEGEEGQPEQPHFGWVTPKCPMRQITVSTRFRDRKSVESVITSRNRTYSEAHRTDTTYLQNHK